MFVYVKRPTLRVDNVEIEPLCRHGVFWFVLLSCKAL